MELWFSFVLPGSCPSCPLLFHSYVPSDLSHVYLHVPHVTPMCPCSPMLPLISSYVPYYPICVHLLYFPLPTVLRSYLYKVYWANGSGWWNLPLYTMNSPYLSELPSYALIFPMSCLCPPHFPLPCASMSTLCLPISPCDPYVTPCYPCPPYGPLCSHASLLCSLICCPMFSYVPLYPSYVLYMSLLYPYVPCYVPMSPLSPYPSTNQPIICGA